MTSFFELLQHSKIQIQVKKCSSLRSTFSISEAHVGLGIYGREGHAAAQVNLKHFVLYFDLPIVVIAILE